MNWWEIIGRLVLIWLFEKGGIRPTLKRRKSRIWMAYLETCKKYSHGERKWRAWPIHAVHADEEFSRIILRPIRCLDTPYLTLNQHELEMAAQIMWNIHSQFLIWRHFSIPSLAPELWKFWLKWIQIATALCLIVPEILTHSNLHRFKIKVQISIPSNSESVFCLFISIGKLNDGIGNDWIISILNIQIHSTQKRISSKNNFNQWIISNMLILRFARKK